MTTTNILGGGAAQAENQENPIGNRVPRYMQAANLQATVPLIDVYDPALMALGLVGDVRDMLRAALAIPASAHAGDEHLRAIIKAVLIRIDYDENVIDSQFEDLFLNGAGVLQ